MTAIAPRRAYFAYPSGPAHKLLMPQREAQFAQSARTRNGQVAPYRPGMPAPKPGSYREWGRK